MNCCVSFLMPYDVKPIFRDMCLSSTVTPMQICLTCKGRCLPLHKLWYLGLLNRGLWTMGGQSSTAVDTKHMNFIKNKINSNCVMMFSKTRCPYCIEAKKRLDSLHVEYDVVEIDQLSNDYNASAVMDALHSMTGARTVPRVFISGECVGGANELNRLYRSGRLTALLGQCQRQS